MEVFELLGDLFVSLVDGPAGFGELQFFGVHEMRIAGVILIATYLRGGIKG